MRKITTFFVCLTLVIPCMADTYIVDPNGSADFTTIQEAINYSWNGDIVIVRPSTYNENIMFNGKNIILTSTNPNSWDVVAVTIIDGNQNGSVVTFAGNEELDCVLTGFTIRNGYAANGAGVYCTDSSPKILHNIIKNNQTWSKNGGYGGGIYCQNSSPYIAYNIVSNNTGYNAAGGIGCDGFSSPVIYNNVITNNIVTAGEGGGLYVGSNYSNPTIMNNTLVGNSTPSRVHGGAGIYLVWEVSGINIRNCIIFANTPDQIWEGSDYGNYNNITYCDISGGWLGKGNIDADPCFADPNGPDDIIGTEDDNLRLLFGSPCIDAGDNNSVPADIADLDGDANTTEPAPFDLNRFPRFTDDCWTTDTGNGTVPIVDMGACEFLPSDIDSKGNIDFVDFCSFAAYWMDTNCETCSGADLTCDGDVDFDDLREFASCWLAGTP